MAAVLPGALATGALQKEEEEEEVTMKKRKGTASKDTCNFVLYLFCGYQSC
jgi:hypothetical protein